MSWEAWGDTEDPPKLPDGWWDENQVNEARAEIEALKRERDEAYERAAQACERESVNLELSEQPTVDFPYNQAVKDCAMAIRALKSEAPTNETGNARPGVG